MFLEPCFQLLYVADFTCKFELVFLEPCFQLLYVADFTCKCEVVFLERFQFVYVATVHVICPLICGCVHCVLVTVARVSVKSIFYCYYRMAC